MSSNHGYGFKQPPDRRRNARAGLRYLPRTGGRHLDPADIILFNLQFEERGGAELFDPSADWEEHVDYDLNPDFFAEVVIGLADTDGGEINDIFARVLLCREKDHKLCHILWRE